MASDQLMAPIPSVVLAPGMIIRFEALSPTAGTAVAGVTVKSISIAGPGSGVDIAELTPGSFLLVPGPQG